MILRVDSPKIMDKLRDSTAGRFIEDALGPTSAIIKPGAIEKVTAALVRLGYLSQVELTDQTDDETTAQEL